MLVHFHNTRASDSKVSIVLILVLKLALAIDIFKVHPVGNSTNLVVSHDAFQIVFRVKAVAAQSAATAHGCHLSLEGEGQTILRLLLGRHLSLVLLSARAHKPIGVSHESRLIYL